MTAKSKSGAKIITNYTPPQDEKFVPEVSIPSSDEIVSSFGNTSINEDLVEQFKVRM